MTNPAVPTVAEIRDRYASNAKWSLGIGQAFNDIEDLLCRIEKLEMALRDIARYPHAEACVNGDPRWTEDPEDCDCMVRPLARIARQALRP